MKDFLFRHLHLAPRGAAWIEAEGDAAEGGAGGDKDEAAQPTVEELQQELADAKKAAEDARKETKSERAARIESERAAATWQERATKAKPAKEEEPAEKEVDLVEALTNGDTKAIRQAVKAMGFVTLEEAKAHIAQEVTGARTDATIEAQLVRDYPDLASDESELFKQTAAGFQDFVKRGFSKAEAMDMAADKAAARLGIQRGGKAKTKPEAETEEERAERIGSQAGSRGGARHTAKQTELTAQQREIADKLGVPHDAYLKRLKAQG